MKSIKSLVKDLIGNLINTVDPGSIVLGGGVVVHNLNFKKILIKHIRNYIFANEVKKIKILSSKLKSDTGLLGSAAIHK